MLRVQENVQVQNGPEPSREGGVWQGFVHVPLLPQYHANEVQPAQPPEEGARLRGQDLSSSEESLASRVFHSTGIRVRCTKTIIVFMFRDVSNFGHPGFMDLAFAHPPGRKNCVQCMVYHSVTFVPWVFFDVAQN